MNLLTNVDDDKESTNNWLKAEQCLLCKKIYLAFVGGSRGVAFWVKVSESRLEEIFSPLN